MDRAAAMVGEFRVHDRDRWWITTWSPQVASALADTLGSEAEVDGSGLWHLVADAKPLPVLVGEVEPHAMVFQVAELADLGWFRLGFDPWCAGDVLGDEVAARLDGWVGGKTAARLGIRPVFYQTRNSMLLRFMAAWLTLT